MDGELWARYFKAVKGRMRHQDRKRWEGWTDSELDALEAQCTPQQRGAITYASRQIAIEEYMAEAGCHY